jgi:hypothetical protein
LSLLVAEPVPVRYKEGLVHGFLALRTLDGETIADGDLIQTAHGDNVTSRLVFRFRDGSLHDDTAVFSQGSTFRLISEHLIQKGPAFKHPMDVTVDGGTGRVIVRYTEDGKEKVATEGMDLPPDIANGLVLTLLKNIRPETKETTVHFLVATPKPTLVKFVITPRGEDAFGTGKTRRKALHYVVKVEVGGLAGVFADLVGKEPPDTHVWILEGEAPAFVKSEGPLAPGGPIWRIELVSPVWPGATSEKRSKK